MGLRLVSGKYGHKICSVINIIYSVPVLLMKETYIEVGFGSVFFLRE